MKLQLCFFLKNPSLVFICSVKTINTSSELTPVVSIYEENVIYMPRKKYRKSRAMEGVEQGSSQFEVQESSQEQDTQPPNVKTCGKF